MASRQPAIHAAVLVIDRDCDAVRERFRKAFAKARIGWLDVKTRANGSPKSTVGRRKPEPITRILVTAWRKPGRVFSDALMCAANAHYSHLFLTSDPTQFKQLLELAKAFPDRLIEDRKGHAAVFPLRRAEEILRSDELHQDCCFEIDLKLHWHKRGWKTETADTLEIEDFFHASAFDGFLTKLRFYCKAQTSRRPWS